MRAKRPREAFRIMTANPFWDFSLDLYERPGVAECCVALQEESGLDVNMLLFCTWCAAEGPGVLEEADVRAAIAATQPWQQRVVAPLRAARRAVRELGTAGIFAAACARDVAATELSAERVEQWLLFELVAGRTAARRGAGHGVAMACQNLGGYLRAAGVDPAPARARLVPLLAGCWPDAEATELRAAAAGIGAALKA
jgi:uncharacterized protein (TIGR02444 family)